MKLLLPFLLAAAMTVHGQIVSSGKCRDDVQTVKRFDVERYAGTWYEIHRYENPEEKDGECVDVEYTLVEGGINVTNSQVVFGTKMTVKGFARQNPEANGDGKLLVNFPDFDDSLYDYWVLTTDYSSYSLVYSCENLTNNSKQISSWILSRQKTLSPLSVLAIDKVIDGVEGLFWQNYRETLQTEAVCKITDK